MFAKTIPPMFIQIKRVTKDRHDNQTVRDEVINTNDIDSFRPWHKGRNDKGIDGDITIIILKADPKKKKDTDSDESETENGDSKKGHLRDRKTILIQESFHDFMDRLNSKGVPVTRLATA